MGIPSRGLWHASVRLIVLAVAAGWVVARASWCRADSALPPPPGAAAPNFALTTQQSGRLWLAQLRGRAVVLAFGCTGCGACPGLVGRLADVAGGLGDAPGRRVFFALVTVDPARDTPAVLRTFGRANGLQAPAWILLTEDRAGEVDVVARRYGVEVRRAGDHVEADCAVTLIDAAGTIRARYAPGSLDALPGDLRALLSRAASP
jgi:cytochrome oxidase Cu insertion factor (SCO1/SenC/PrrC family)